MHTETYEYYTKNASIWWEKLPSVRFLELESSLTECILDTWDRKAFVSESLIKENSKRLLPSVNHNLAE